MEADQRAELERLLCRLSGVATVDEAFAATSGHVRIALLRVLQALAEMPDELSVEIKSFDEFVDWLSVRSDGGRSAIERMKGESAQAQSRVRLREVLPDDFEPIYRASANPRSGFRWRFKGSTPSPEVVSATLWDNVLCQFIVEGANDGHRYGLVTAYNADHVNQTVWFAILRLSQRRAEGETFEGLFHFLEYLFRNWQFRKIYCEIPGYNESMLVGIGQEIAAEEARLIDHEFKNGQFWDQITLAIHRDRWNTFAEPWREWAGRGI